MRTVHSVVAGLALAAAVGFPLTAHAITPLLTNGSFETMNQPLNGDGSGIATVPGASLNLPGWTVTGTSVDAVPNSYWQSSNGNISVDVDGTPGHGGLSQSVATTPGTHYTLTFDFSINPEAGLPGELALQRLLDLTITAGDATVLHTENFGATQAILGNSKTNMLYTGESVDFTAKDSLTTISFASIGQTTYTGPVLDNVVLVESGGATPEPATLSILGLAGMGLLVRRKR